MLRNTKIIFPIFLILAIFACQGAAQEAKAKGQYASVNGLKMYYETHGTGQPLVLLHGSFSWTSFGYDSSTGL